MAQESRTPHPRRAERFHSFVTAQQTLCQELARPSKCLIWIPKLRDPGRQRLILGAGLGGHRLDRFEFLARHEIHVGHQPFQPLLHEGVDLGPHALGHAGCVGEDLCHAVEERIVGLCHQNLHFQPSIWPPRVRLDTSREAPASYPFMIQALLPFPHIDPVLLSLGPFAIRWYALAYIAGIVLGWWGVLRVLAQQTALGRIRPSMAAPPATEDDIGDLVVWATLGVIIGRPAGLGC